MKGERLTESNKREICPEEGCKVNFTAATAFARKIVHNEKKVVSLTGNHRGTVATIDLGWIIIDQKWYTK